MVLEVGGRILELIIAWGRVISHVRGFGCKLGEHHIKGRVNRVSRGWGEGGSGEMHVDHFNLGLLLRRASALERSLRGRWG